MCSFLAGVHLSVAGFVVVLREAGRSTEHGAYHGAGLEHQSALVQSVIYVGKDFVDQLLFSQPMAQSQDGLSSCIR